MKRNTLSVDQVVVVVDFLRANRDRVTGMDSVTLAGVVNTAALVDSVVTPNNVKSAARAAGIELLRKAPSRKTVELSQEDRLARLERVLSSLCENLGVPFD